MMSAAAESFSSPAPRRIAVFRASRPSSLLRSVPALRALREAYPEASITLVGIEESQGFERRFHRYLDDFLVFPGATCNTRVPYAAGADNPGVVDPGMHDAGHPAELSRFYAEATRRRFDIAIQLQDGAASWNRIVARLGAARWAGFVPANAPVLNTADPAAVLMPWPSHLPEIQRYTALVQRLGVAVNSTALELPLIPDDHQQADALFQNLGLNPNQTVLLHPGAHRPDEAWPIENYAQLAQQLSAYGWQVAIIGHEQDSQTTQRLRAAMRTFAIDLTNALTAAPFGAVLAKCRLLVCNRPSVSHAAAALHTPTIVLASGNDRNRWLLPDNGLHTILWPQPDNASASPSRSAASTASGSGVVDVEHVLLHARYKLGMVGALA